MRKFPAVALLITAVAVPVVAGAAPTVSAATVPCGFVDSPVASLGASTGIVGMPDGTVMVLEQSGSVRLIRSDTLLPAPALTLELPGCNGGERGLLGVALDPNFKANGFVYLYYTTPSPGSPGGCVNRVSRFTMTGDTIDPASEMVLRRQHLRRSAGNHNGGDLEIGADGFLYVSIGDAGSDPRGLDGAATTPRRTSACSTARSSASTGSTGEPAPGQPAQRAPARPAAASRGNTAVDADDRVPGDLRVGPAQPVPLRVRPERRRRSGSSSTTSARAPVRRSTTAASVATTAGPSARASARTGQNPPCAGPPRRVHRSDHRLPAQRRPGTSPAARSSRTASGRRSTTAATCSPTAAAARSGSAVPTARRLRHAVRDATCGRHRRHGVRREPRASRCTTRSTGASSVRKITSAARPTSPTPARSRSCRRRPATAVLDTRQAPAGDRRVPRRHHPLRPDAGVDGAVTKAVLVNLAFVAPDARRVPDRVGRRRSAAAADVEHQRARGEVVANAAVVPGRCATAAILVYVVLDGRRRGRRARPLRRRVRGRRAGTLRRRRTRSRIADTRQPLTSTEPVHRGAGSRSAVRAGARRRPRRRAGGGGVRAPSCSWSPR